MPEPNDSENTEDQLRKDALKDASVMNEEGTKYGIPSTLFYGGVMLSVVFAMTMRWWTGVGFAAVYFLTMYEIHKNDPKALQGWIEAAISRRLDVWTSGLHKQRKFYVLKDKD